MPSGALVPADEVLVECLRTLPSAVAICNQRVYHIEVYQALTSLDHYPCIVYQITENMADGELSGLSSFINSIYSVYVISKDSADLRTLGMEIMGFGEEEYNDEIYETYGNINWIHAENESEQGEFALEQEEKGYKISTHTITIQHWGK